MSRVAHLAKLAGVQAQIGYKMKPGQYTRCALQGNAGIKLYLTPSDEEIVEELSGAVGITPTQR